LGINIFQTNNKFNSSFIGGKIDLPFAHFVLADECGDSFAPVLPFAVLVNHFVEAICPYELLGQFVELEVLEQHSHYLMVQDELKNGKN
jgi:hypothetical protein